MSAPELPEGAEVRSAIVWFRGYPETSEHFAGAVASGGFCHRDPDPPAMPLHVYPAAVETSYATGQPRTEQHGLRVGVDVHRGCWVIDVPHVGVVRQRVLLNLRAGMAAVQIARIAVGQQGQA